MLIDSLPLVEAACAEALGHPKLKCLMHDTLRDWNARGTGVILISLDMGSIFDLCRRIIVLQNGRVIANGPPEAVRSDPAVLQAYLGTRSARVAS